METPKEIATYLKLCNRLHFSQAQGMPFTVPPLLVEFDWVANSVTSEIVLEGEYNNSELNFLQSKLLEHCKKEHDNAIIGEEVQIYEWKDKIKTWKEQTTTLPLGKHLGHYKALLSQGLDNPKSDEGKDLRAKQDILIEVHVDLLNYALKH
eukprot:10892499-Ditylum_brightwellii.AAC.1